MNKTKLKLIPFIIILIGVSYYFYHTEKQVDNPLRFTGNVEGKEISITTQVSGELKELNVHEGKSIKFDDSLFNIDVSDYDIRLKQLQLKEKIADLKYEQLLNGASNDDVNYAVSNKNSISKKLIGAQKNYKHLKSNYDNLLELYNNGSVSKTDLDNAKSGMDQAYSAMTSLQNQVEAAQATLDKLLKGAEQESIEIAKTESELRELEIVNLENTIAKGEKKSPISGVIQTINYEVGEYINPGMNLLSIINMDRLTIDIYVQQKKLHLINVGDRVVISEDFLEDKEVLGKISSISSKAEFTPKNVESKESKQEMVFKVTIEVIKGQEHLRPGMFVDVDIQAAKE